MLCGPRGSEQRPLFKGRFLRKHLLKFSKDKDETISDLIDRQQIHLLDEGIEKKIEENCNNSEKVNIERCSELYNSDDKEYMKRLYNESELIIINNS